MTLVNCTDSDFWRGKKVFLTGHTGFKGSWLALWLHMLGAEVSGYSLEPNTSPNLYSTLGIAERIHSSVIGDIRDFDNLKKQIFSVKPEIVFHLAAQPLVRQSYVNPIETYSTNVMGTLYVLEAIKCIDSVRATVIVTTDKCYENREWEWGYRENEPMGGRDPYSSSKGCAELLTAAYRHSYFPLASYATHRHAIASARAGNVIGGGDWSSDRLIPDAIKAFESGSSLLIRNPSAIRPWQHVLEPLSGYLLLGKGLFENGPLYASGWNFGPKDDDARSVSEVVELLISAWGSPACWNQDVAEHPHEANFLKLDCSKSKQYLNWSPKWNLEQAISKISEWHSAFKAGRDMYSLSTEHINEYMQAPATKNFM